MKKTLVFLLFVTVIISSLIFSVCADGQGAGESYVCGTYTYGIEYDGAVIYGCSADVSGELVIPSTLDGYEVVGIAERAFLNCNNITSVVIPFGVVVIRDNAFSGCNKLESVEIPNSVIRIGNAAFSNFDNN